VSPVLSARIRRWLLRFVTVAFLSALSVTAILYAVDYVVFRYRVAKDQQPFGQITVTRYYAVEQKSGKTQFIFQPPEAQSCVHSLFPHADCVPCWYLERHTEQRTDI
jgi:hypothetical protein